MSRRGVTKRSCNSENVSFVQIVAENVTRVKNEGRHFLIMSEVPMLSVCFMHLFPLSPWDFWCASLSTNHRWCVWKRKLVVCVRVRGWHGHHEYVRCYPPARWCGFYCTRFSAILLCTNARVSSIIFLRLLLASVPEVNFCISDMVHVVRAVMRLLVVAWGDGIELDWIWLDWIDLTWIGLDWLFPSKCRKTIGATETHGFPRITLSKDECLRFRGYCLL